MSILLTEILYADNETFERELRSKSWVRPPGAPRGWGQKGQTSTFSEHGHKRSKMVAKFLPAGLPTPTLGIGSMGQNSTFLEHGHVAYQVIGIQNAATW